MKERKRLQLSGKNIIVLLILVILSLFSCQEEELSTSNTTENDSGSVLLDKRNNVKYKVVTIGSQQWMAENLNIGVLIPGNEKDDTQGNDTLIEKFCLFDLELNCDKYGGLYEWSEAMQIPNHCNDQKYLNIDCIPKYNDAGNLKGICPMGWHLPSAGEWLKLFNYVESQVGELSYANYLKAKMLTDTIYNMWDTTNNINDTFGFSLLPAGGREWWNGLPYSGEGYGARFWTSTESFKPYDAVNVYFTRVTTTAQVVEYYKTNSFSIRCIKDSDIDK